jgi:hypothetical protein
MQYTQHNHAKCCSYLDFVRRKMAGDGHSFQVHAFATGGCYHRDRGKTRHNPGRFFYCLLTATNFRPNMLSRSGLVVKFVLAMHEPRVRFTAATLFCPLRACYHIFCSVITLPESIGDVVCSHELSGALIEALDSTHNCCRKAFNACITKHTVGRLSENG